MEIVDQAREKVGEVLLWMATKVAPNPLPEQDLEDPQMPDVPTPEAPDLPELPGHEGEPGPDGGGETDHMPYRPEGINPDLTEPYSPDGRDER